MDWSKTFSKSVWGFVYGLAATIIFGIVQAISNYQPIICSETVTTNCTPQAISTIYYAMIPAIVSFLMGFGNWLKNKDN